MFLEYVVVVFFLFRRFYYFWFLLYKMFGYFPKRFEIGQQNYENLIYLI